MLSIAAVSDASYYLRSGSGCGGGGGPSGSAAEYELNAVAAGEPPGEWYAPNRNQLGVEGEIHAEGASGEAFRTVLNELRHPVTGEQLGRAPMKFLSPEERLAQWQRKNPHATEEQVAEQRVRAEQNHRQANHAWDMTFSPPKSWSVLHAALQRDERPEEAAEVAAALRAGVDAALRYAADELGFTRRGTSGPEVAGRATSHFVRETDFQTAVFAHHTSRDRDPQLHFHVMLLNRIMCDDGSWRAIYSPSILKSKHALDAIFLRVAEAELTARLGVRFAARPDGKAREVVGVPAEVRDLFSSRTRARTEAAQELVDQYEQTYGKKPSALILWRMNQRATLRTRKAKPKDAPTREQDLARWEAECAAEFREGLAAVVEGVDEAARAERADEVLEPDAVIALALDDLSRRKSTWNRSHLMHAIDRQLPDMLAIEPARVPELLSELTDAALAGRQVVSLAATAPVKVPASLRDAKSGESVFEAPTGGRYTSATHLAREDSLVARLQRRGAPVLTETSAAAVLAGRGLSDEQLAVGTAVLTSDRHLQVVNAAAGTGKTRLMRALSDASTATWGHGLTGFTTAQNAAEVLQEEGVSRAHNITKYLHFRDRERHGQVSDLERAVFSVPRGGTVVVDEASMVSTPDLTALLRELDEAGVGRVVMIGDTAQVEAIDAGGAFGLLVEQREPHTLTQVRRFSQEWEAQASTRIREGDLTALSEYDARARIRGDGLEPEQVEAEAVRTFVDDHLSGRETVLVVGTGEAAARVSSSVREQLVRAGHVAREGVRLHDETTAGVGDVVQTRQNDRGLGVVNRQVWQVVAVDEVAGTVDVRPRSTESDRTTELADGVTSQGITCEPQVSVPPIDIGIPSFAPVTLPAAYVGEHLELGYASTVEAVQGRTTDTAHVLVDDLMGRSRVYPALTRGREANTAWVPVTPPARRVNEPDAAYEARIPTALSGLVAALERDDRTEAARTVQAVEEARSTNLGHLGPQWQTLVAEHRALDHLDVLREVLGERAHAVAADRALDGVLHLIRGAEVAGHDPRAVLADAARGVDLEGARSPAGVLYRRIEKTLGDLPARGEQRQAFTYVGRTPAGAGERIEFARGVAAAMDARTTELGEQVVAAPPAWAVDRFGPLPDDEVERATWQGKAAVVAAFREQYGWAHATNPIGSAPSRSEPERRWAWERAADVLGFSERDRDMAACADAELGSRVLAWRREQEWMPRNVDADLRETHLGLGEARRVVVDARTRGEDTTVAEAEAATLVARAERLELVARGRALAARATEEVRDRAQEALAELERRVGLDRAAMDREEAEQAPEREAVEERAEVDARVHEVVHERIVGHGEAMRSAPVFGSQRWAELGDEEPEKRASIFTAALSWWRAGDARDAEALTERLAEHGVDQAPEHHLTARGLERVREGEDELEVRRSEPSADLEVLQEVHRVTGREVGEEAPEFGSAGYADADERGRDRAEDRAAVAFWNVGDDLDERAARAEAAEEKAAARDIEEMTRERRHAADQRSHAEVAKERGEEPPERPVVEEEPEREPERPDVSWTREVAEVEHEAPERGDDLAEHVARAQAAIERLREEPEQEQTQEPERAPVAEREGAER